MVHHLVHHMVHYIVHCIVHHTVHYMVHYMGQNMVHNQRKYVHTAETVRDPRLPEVTTHGREATDIPLWRSHLVGHLVGEIGRYFGDEPSPHEGAFSEGERQQPLHPTATVGYTGCNRRDSRLQP